MKILGGALALCVCLLLAGMALAEGEAPREGWLVICGTFDDSPAAWRMRAKVDGILGSPARVIATDEYEKLTPGLRVLSAGLYRKKERASAIRNRLSKGGVKCYIKQTAVKKIVANDLIFVGDRDTMWFCFQRGGVALSYASCARHLAKGKTLLRGHSFGKSGAVGFQRVRVLRAKALDSDSPCADFYEYSGTVRETKRLGKPVPGDAKLKKRFREFVEEKSKLKFPKLRFDRVVSVDVTGDGKPDTVIGASAGITMGSMKIDGHVLCAVVVIDGARPEAEPIPVFFHAVPHKKATKDYYLASIYGKLAGLADVNGDGRTDILIGNGYYEGRGLIAYTIKKGKAKDIASNGCGA